MEGARYILVQQWFEHLHEASHLWDHKVAHRSWAATKGVCLGTAQKQLETQLTCTSRSSVVST